MADPLAIVLLPGLDGTGLLFRPLLEVLPDTLDPIVVSYPQSRPLGYRELEDLVSTQLPTDREFAILAESFSGPIGVRVAARHPEGLRGLILVASFIKNPLWGMLRHLRFLIRAPLFWFGPPKSLVRRRLAGPDAPEELVERIIAANHLVRAPVIARRVREVLDVDASPELVKVHAPILYLRAEQDRQIAPDAAEVLATLRPDMEIASVPAPHLLLQREPALAVEIIRSFLDPD